MSARPGRRIGGERASLTANLAAALPGWVVARVLVAGAVVVAHMVDEQLGPVAGVGGRHHIHVHVREALHTWDGVWYLRIVTRGYGGLPRSAVRFFPLYPLTARAFTVVLRGWRVAALLVVANLGALLGAALLHRLALRETGDEALARRAAWLVALLPPSFVLAMAYSEGLFLVVSVAFFLALRGERWWSAAVLGALGGLCRPTGLLLSVPAVVEAARGVRRRGSVGIAGARRRVPAVGRLAAVAGPAVGCGAYLAWVGHRFGSVTLPFRAQQIATLRGRTESPVSVLVTALRSAVHNHWGGNAAHLPAAAVIVVLVVVACRRWPGSYGALAVVTLIVALSSHRVGSLERYVLLTFPLVLALATVTRRAWAERAAFALGAGSLLAYAALALVGLAVP